VGFAANEAIEILETSAASGPVIEWPDRAAFPHGHFVTLAELGGGIAIEFQCLCQCGARVGLYGVLSRSGRRKLRNRTHADGVMVPPAEQRGTRRRTQRGRMEARVLQPVGRQLLEVGRLTRPAEGRRGAEARIVDQHDQKVWGALRRTDLTDRGVLRVRISRVKRRECDWCHIRNRQHTARDSVLPLIRFVAAFRRLCRWSPGHWIFLLGHCSPCSHA